MDVSEIKQKVNKEFKTHEGKKAEEVTRHKEQIAQIRKEVGIQKLKELKDEARGYTQTASETKGKIEKRVKETIFYLSDKKNMSIPTDAKSGSSWLRNSKDYTIRDENVYKYRKRQTASLYGIVNKKDIFKEITDDKEKLEIIEEVLELSSKVVDDYTKIKAEKKLETEIHGKKGLRAVAETKYGGNVNIELYGSGKYNSKEIEPKIRGGYNHDINRNLDIILELRDEIKELLEEIVEGMKEKTKDWEEKREEINNKGSNYLVMEKL